MKRVLFLICVLSLVANTVLAQERPEMRRENRRNTETTERQIPPGHPERVDGQNPNAEKQPKDKKPANDFYAVVKIEKRCRESTI